MIMSTIMHSDREILGQLKEQADEAGENFWDMLADVTDAGRDFRMRFFDALPESVRAEINYEGSTDVNAMLISLALYVSSMG